MANQFKIGVVVATQDRPELLSKRSIPSILGQSRPPDFLIVVDDSHLEENRKFNENYIKSIDTNNTTVAIIRNHRTPGACGSWNTGIDWIFRQHTSPQFTYVAILDDDDSWLPNYLETCMNECISGNFDMVAADIQRFESEHTEPVIYPAPSALYADDFLVGNGGIQGSNIFIRMSAMLMAGCFDESLRSSTDRDLCIRLADLAIVRYARIPETLVKHFAEPDRPRLTTSGSEVKLSGLDTFWCKYAGRMTPFQRIDFKERALTLFHWRPPTTTNVFLDPPPIQRVALVIGISSSHPHLEALIHCNDNRIIGLDIVLCESDQECDFTTKVTKLRRAGMGCFPLSLDLQNTIQSKPVTALEYYSHAVAQSRIGTDVWIVDGNPDYDTPIEILTSLEARNSPTIELGPINDEIADHIHESRIETANIRVYTNYGCSDLRLLGYGSEAVVFTDGKTVYKCIDYWKTRLPKSQFKFLQSKIGAWGESYGLYTLHEVNSDGSWALITYDYEPSVPFDGGNEEGVLKLLESCRDADIVCNNIHPKNLVITDDGVHLIDYGSDIRPFTALGFEHMVIRAFLTCHHAEHPHLSRIMRTCLDDLTLPIMRDYPKFRSKLSVRQRISLQPYATPWKESEPPDYAPLHVTIGVITSEPRTAWPLLQSVAQEGIVAKFLLLDNGCPTDELVDMLSQSEKLELDVSVVDQRRQQDDAKRGLFGRTYTHRPLGQVGIAQARTMIQRYLAREMAGDPNSIGWLLDDDMRVDNRACEYLRWLPALKSDGVDVVLGAYEGSSPNPPLNGMRVLLVDLLHNIQWLDGLPPELPLPNRTEENQRARDDYPDYYYDLSRKHTAHLEQPHWVEPIVPTETVREARSRLLHEGNRIMEGNYLTRPLIANTPLNPLKDARDSVNRGGCTFILNSSALTLTPNMITNIHGREARRSDMLWAIVNRYYRSLVVKAVAFPVDHVARPTSSSGFNLLKVQGEIIGSAMYAAITEFLTANPTHTLAFTNGELNEVERQFIAHLHERIIQLEKSIFRIRGLKNALKVCSGALQLHPLLRQLEWFTQDNWDVLRQGITSQSTSEVRSFLGSLREVADDYERADIPSGE